MTLGPRPGRVLEVVRQLPVLQRPALGEGPHLALEHRAQEHDVRIRPAEVLVDPVADRALAAMMLAVRAPQSKAPMVALLILSASISATISSATAACWPLRTVSFERKRVVP